MVQKKSIKRKEKKSSNTAQVEQKIDSEALSTFNAMTAAVGCTAKPEGNGFILDVIAALHRIGYGQEDVVRAAKYVNNPATQDAWMREHLTAPSKALAYLFFTRTRTRDIKKSLEAVAQWIVTAQEWEASPSHAAVAVASNGRPVIRRSFGGNNE